MKIPGGLLLKLSGVFGALFVLAILITSGLNISSSSNSSTEIALIMGKNMISADMTSLENSISLQYGELKLLNGDLADGQGKTIKNDFSLVDMVSKSLGVHVTIFVKDNQNFRRVTTSIVDASGKRAVDTMLDTASPAYSSILSGKEYSGKALVLGKDYLSVYRPIYPPAGSANSREVIGILFIGMDMDAIEGHIVDIRNKNIINAIIQGVATLVIALIIVVLFAWSIVKPIRSVVSTLKDISEGEGDLTRKIDSTSNDEVGDLSRYFNKTLEKIKDLVIAVKKQTAYLSNIGNDLASHMTETAAGINEITSHIQNIKGQVIGQSASVSETNATMEQLTVNISKLDGHVEIQSSNINQAGAAIEEMVANTRSVTDTLVKNGDNVKLLMEASEVGRTGLSDVAADIQEIARESDGLMEINAVMDNIASQTNLLSMNAAIEAAHAGEAGKGFAVVADEIRKLAENSSEQSKTISTVLKKIASSISKITKSTENVLGKFEAIDSSVRTVSDQEDNIRNAMEEQGAGSRQVLEGVSNITDVTRKVKSSSEEMLSGSNEVIRECKNLEKVTQEISGGMSEMATGAEQINAAVNQVNELSAKNSECIGLLVTEISRFKVE